MFSATLHSTSSQLLSGSHDALMFNLAIKTKEMQQIGSSLRNVMLLPEKERASWVNEHEQFVQGMLDDFVYNASIALDGLQLDSEGMKLSMEFVMSLRDTMNVLQNILYEGKTLKT